MKVSKSFAEDSPLSDPIKNSKRKDEIRKHFRNISRVIDCVGCEKCRLWGKIQITGLGTALKILYSFPDNLPEKFFHFTNLLVMTFSCEDQRLFAS